MWHTLRKEDVLKSLVTNEKTGLSEKEVLKRQEKDGKNKLQEKKKEIRRQMQLLQIVYMKLTL